MRTSTLPFVFLGLVVVLIGCSKNPNAPARISGKISYKGQPIKAGVMQFHLQDGSAINASITSDGTYVATDLPVGEMVVTVETESINPGAKGVSTKDSDRRMKMQGSREPPSGMGGSPKTENLYIKIPDKYAKAATSPLSVKLTAGRQVHDFDLE